MDVAWPPLQQWNFSTNCEAYARYLTAFTIPDRFNKSQPVGPALIETLTLFELSIPATGPKVDDTTDYSAYLASLTQYILKVFVEDGGTLAYTKTVIEPSQICPQEFCMALGYAAASDFTGIGVMTSYFVESALATLFLMAFTVYQLKHTAKARRARSPGKPGKLQPAATFSNRFANRVMDAFRGSLLGFLSSAMLLCVSMLVGAIYTAGDRLKEFKKESWERELLPLSGVYDIAFSILTSIFSIFPVLVVYALMRHPEKGQEGRHRKWLRRAVVVLIWALSIAEVFLGPKAEDFNDPALKQAEAATPDGAKFDDFCDHRGPHYLSGLKASQFLVIGAPLAWAAVTFFLFVGLRIPGVVDLTIPATRRWSSAWRLSVAWVNLLAMWGLLAYITVLRKEFRDSSGRLGDDGKWNFGQVLALFLWVPVICDFFYILVFGMEETLSGSLPHDYMAVHREPPPASQGGYGQGYFPEQGHYVLADSRYASSGGPEYNGSTVFGDQAMLVSPPPKYPSPAIGAYDPIVSPPSAAAAASVPAAAKDYAAGGVQTSAAGSYFPVQSPQPGQTGQTPLLQQEQQQQQQQQWPTQQQQTPPQAYAQQGSYNGQWWAASQPQQDQPYQPYTAQYQYHQPQQQQQQ